MAMKSVQSSGKSPLALKPFSKGSEDLVKAPATNPPAKDLEVYTVNIGQIPSALASWTTEAINSGSFCRIDPDMETWLIPKQKLLDIAESKSSWLDMIKTENQKMLKNVVGHIQSVQGSALNNATATTRVVVHFLISRKPSSNILRGGWTEGFDEGKANGEGNSVQFNGNEVHDFVSCGESHPESPEIYSLPGYNLNFELVDEEDCCYFQATKKHVVQARGGDIFDVYRKKRVNQKILKLCRAFFS
ncbi:unnamed protein product [Brassica napus]|uniref:(rape) hypothetical protein n=1 Tax=Brassica napus TaxID=3708 RepID=A0A817B0E9_BRANA|nr:unnamed protein product [Brassica napus]